MAIAGEAVAHASLVDGSVITLHGHSLSTVESFRTSDLSLTANTYADNVSISLGAGTWLIVANTTVQSPNATAQRVTVKLWDGTNVYASSEAAAPSQGTGSTKGYVSICLSSVEVLSTTTTVKTSVASTAASVVDATPGDNATGLTNTANSIRAVKIA